MSCANCSTAVTEAVERLDGVESATVNYATDEGTVEYDPEQVSLREIHEAVESAGYTPIAADLTVAVTDMSCANCAETIQSRLLDTEGVLSAEVNYATDEAQVSYDPGVVSRETIYDAVEDAGYSPVREEGDDEGASAADAARDAETARQRRLVLFGAALSIPLSVLTMGGLVGIPVPDTVFGVGKEWVALLLATPVQVVLGREFYENSYTALVRNRTANMDVLIAMGSTTAYLYSVAVLLALIPGGFYFESAALILTFITLGNYLEARSKSRAGDAIRELLEMEADTARLVTETEDGYTDEREVDRVNEGFERMCGGTARGRRSWRSGCRRPGAPARRRWPGRSATRGNGSCARRRDGG